MTDETEIGRCVELCRTGDNPAKIGRVPSGWVVLADWQITRGYCILMADPVVPDLNALGEAARAQFLLDMALVGDALLEVTGAARINYSILGNGDPTLHAHIVPRFADEPEKWRGGPVWFYPEEDWFRHDPAVEAPLIRDLGAALAGLPG